MVNDSGGLRFVDWVFRWWDKVFRWWDFVMTTTRENTWKMLLSKSAASSIEEVLAFSPCMLPGVPPSYTLNASLSNWGIGTSAKTNDVVGWKCIGWCVVVYRSSWLIRRILLEQRKSRKSEVWISVIDERLSIKRQSKREQAGSRLIKRSYCASLHMIRQCRSTIERNFTMGTCKPFLSRDSGGEERSLVLLPM